MKYKILFPAVYCAIALLAWADFSNSPPDGLANAGLMLVALPITLLDLALRPNTAPGSFVLMPDSLGYYTNHAVFFAGSVIVIGTGLWLLGAWIDSRHASRKEKAEDQK